MPVQTVVCVGLWLMVFPQATTIAAMLFVYFWKHKLSVIVRKQ